MELIARAWSDAWEPPDNRQIYEWGKDHVDLPRGGYAIPGPFHVEKSRHLIEPLECLKADDVTQLTIMAPPQSGKSLIPDVWHLWTLANHPGPVMMVMQTDKIMQDHAEVRCIPSIRNCRRLAHLLPDDVRQVRKGEIVFKNGVPIYFRGPALGNAQSKSIRYLSISEAWILERDNAGMIGEFLNRTSAYEQIGTSKVCIESQGGELLRDGEGRIVGGEFILQCLKGTGREWGVHCLECGKYFHPWFTIKRADGSFAGMRWDKGGENVRYECEHCGQAMIDTDRTKALWNSGGRYETIRPGTVKGHVHHHWNRVICGSWEKMVQKYLHAIASKRMGVIGPIREFDQKDRAECFDEAAQFETSAVDIRSENYNPLEPWAEEKFRFLTVDCQAHLTDFWAVIRAWGAGGKSRRLWRGRLNSFEEIRAKQLEFGVLSQFVILDIGYEQTKVFRQCCRYVDENGRGWIGMKGTNPPAENYPHTNLVADAKGHRVAVTDYRIYSKPETGDPALGLQNEEVQRWLAGVSKHAMQLYAKGKLKATFYLFADFATQDILQALITGQGAEWLSPDADAGSAEDIYRKQLAAEIRTTETDPRGKEKRVYKRVGANHYRDCEKMQVAAAMIPGALVPA